MHKLTFPLLFTLILILGGNLIAYSQPDWMTRNAAILGPKRLNEIAIPGAHDAGTFAIVIPKGSGLFGIDDGLTSPDNSSAKKWLSITGVFSKWAKTQERTTTQMLDDGIRYLDIRVCVNNKGILMTCHGLYGASVESILDDVNAFSAKYPKEVILLGFNHFWDREYQLKRNKGQGETEGLTEAKWTALIGMIKTKLGKKLLSNKTFSPTSKLRDVWDSKIGGRIITLFDTDDAPTDPLIWTRQEENTWVGGWKMLDFKAGTLTTLQNAATKKYANKFYAIRSSVTPDDTGKLIGLGIFSKDYPSSASELANETNPVVFSWIKNDWAAKYPINLIWADFYNRHGLVDLAKSINGIKVGRTRVKLRQPTKWKSWKEPNKKSLFTIN